MARRIEQAFRCAPNMPGLGMVMCQPFRLMRDDVGKARFNDLSDASVQLTAPGLGERLIGGFLNERMTKHMDLRRRQAGTIDQLVVRELVQDRKSTRLNSSHANISYAVFCLKKKTQ